MGSALRCADKKQKGWVSRPGTMQTPNSQSLGFEDEEQRPGLAPFLQREGARGSFKWLLFSNVRINFPGRRMFWIFFSWWEEGTFNIQLRDSLVVWGV